MQGPDVRLPAQPDAAGGRRRGAHGEAPIRPPLATEASEQATGEGSEQVGGECGFVSEGSSLDDKITSLNSLDGWFDRLYAKHYSRAAGKKVLSRKVDPDYFGGVLPDPPQQAAGDEQNRPEPANETIFNPPARTSARASRLKKLKSLRNFFMFKKPKTQVAPSPADVAP